MGVVCCAKDDDSTSGGMVDLPPPISIKGRLNKIEAFEMSLPFNRIYLRDMNDKIALAEEKSGIEGAVTLKSLRAVLTTPAWEPLSD